MNANLHLMNLKITLIPDMIRPETGMSSSEGFNWRWLRVVCYYLMSLFGGLGGVHL